MLPWIDSWPAFFLALVPVYWLAVLAHEAGHAIAGRLAGYDVLALGLGFGRPWASVRLGRVVLYLGRPLTGGLTIAAHEGIRPRRAAQLAFCAGGPAADVAGCALSLAAWHLGARWEPVAIYFYATLLHVAIAFMPLVVRTGQGFTLRSDALLILGAWLERTDETPPGATVEAVRGVRLLSEQIGAVRGTVAFTLALALLHLQLFDHETAEELLRAPCLADPRRGGAFAGLEALVRASLACAQDADDAAERLDEADALIGGTAEGAAFVLALRAERALRRDEDSAQEVAERAHAAAGAAGIPELQGALVAIGLAAAPDARVIAEAPAVLARAGRGAPPPTPRVYLAQAHTRALVRMGRHDEARDAFLSTRQRIEALAETIQEPRTRRRFLQRATTLLQDAVAELPAEQPPLYLHAGPAAAERAPAPPAGGGRGMGLAAVPLLVGALVFLLIRFDEPYALGMIEDRSFVNVLAILVLAMVVSLLLLVSRRARWTWAACAFLLNAYVLLAATSTWTERSLSGHDLDMRSFAAPGAMLPQTSAQAHATAALPRLRVSLRDGTVLTGALRSPIALAIVLELPGGTLEAIPLADAASIEPLPAGRE